MNRKRLEKWKIPESIRIPYFGGVWYRYISKKENEWIRKIPVTRWGLNQEKRDITITASLTSFPPRIEFAHLAVKSLLLQSCKPDRLILWLANEQFPDHVLPAALTKLTQYGLEIRWCEDLCGHKKYFYCLLEQQPDEVLITFDDDIIYPQEAIARLVKMHRRFPKCLICERAQAIDYEKDGTLKNPGRWKTISNIGVKKPSYSLNPSPGGGCLIPYRGFYKDACNKEKIQILADKNDDLWYMFMAAENGTRTIKTQKFHRSFSLIDGSQIVQMATENVIGDYNQVVMDGLSQVYPTAYRRILYDKD